MKKPLLFGYVLFLLHSPFVFSQWTQLNNDINGSTADDRLGSAVTLSANGNRIATGAPLYNNGAAADAGQVRLYEQQGAIWTVIAQYTGAAAGDGLGTSVSLSADGNRLAVGAPLNDTTGNNAGQVYLYHYTAGSWSLITTLNGELANDQFGSSVSLSADGMRLAVGAPFNDAGTGNAADNRGRVRLYQYNGASWVAFPNALANSINGLAAGDQSGRTVSLSTDGSRVAIGAPLGDGGFADSGYTRIFQYNSGNSTWEQLGSALNGEAAGDQSGAAVSLSADGNRVAIGAPLNDADSGIATDNPGHVRVYQYSAGAWAQVGTDLNGYALGDQFGKAVSLNTDGSRLAIGAPYYNGNTGRVYAYQLHGSSWLPLGAAFDGEAGGDESGSSVSLSAEGSRVAIGAPLNDGGGLSAGQVRLYEYAIPDTSLGEGAGTDAGGQANMFLGYYSGHNTTTGSDNTFVGAESGYNNTTGSGNVYLGYRAGYDETTGNDHLFIDNSDTPDPLIWGDFAADALRINGSLRVNNLPQDDALNRVLVADVTGNLNWREAATLNTDNQDLSLSSSGTTRTLNISGGNGVNIDVADNDNDPTNEYNTGASLTDTTLNITDGGGTVSIDLGTTFATDSEVAATYAPKDSPIFNGTPTAPTPAAGTNTTQLATTAFVTTANSSKANLASPSFTGIPAAPTAAAGTNTTQLATTAFVTAADNLKANLASPTFTGIPAAPTAAAGTNTTQLATTAFVTAADNLKANLASPTFTGTVTAPTFAGNLSGNATTATTVTTNANLTGPVTSVGNATAIANGAITNAMLANTAVANLSGTNTGDQNLAPYALLNSPTFTGIPAAPTAAAGTNTTQLATTAFVTAADNLKANLASPTFTGTVTAPTFAGNLSGNATTATTVTTNANLTGPVTSVGNATAIANGAITNAMLANTAVANLSGTNTGDQNLAPYALLNSPTFTGIPAAPTAAAGTNTTQLATTAFVTAADNLKANLASPTFTGIPAAPTAAAGTNTTQLATTAFVTAADNLKANLASPTFTGTVTAPTFAGNLSGNATTATTVTTNANLTGPVTSVGNATAIANGAITNAMLANTAVANLSGTNTGDQNLAPYALLNSPTFTGIPAAPTAAAGTNTTQLATTAFVTAADNLKANLASPTFTGIPAAPTAAAGTNTTQLATTAFVTAADNLKANLASPTFTGTVTAPAFAGNLTGNATTVTTNANLTGPVTSVGNATAIANGAITNAMLANTAVANLSGTNTGDQNLAPYALLNSPTFTGIPAAPTAVAGTNTTQLATTQFVTTAISTSNSFPSFPASAGDGGTNSNSYFGHESGLVNTGTNNTFIGYRSGFNTTTGSNNTTVGYNTGLGITTGTGNTILGANVIGLPAGLTNTIILADGTGNQRLYIDNLGRVGIGTIVPSQVLEVAGSPGNIRLTRTIVGGPAAGETIGLIEAANQTYNSGSTSSVRFVAETGWSGGDYNSQIQFWTRPSYNNPVQRMVITKNGNVGIGTLTPSEILDVTGNVRFSGALLPNNNAGLLGQVLTSAGAGIAPTWTTKTLNGLGGSTQTFATGTAGNDFAISSSGSVHTFNLPSASSTSRGLLSILDWNTFNNKANTDSPNFTGTPTALTAAAGTSTNQLATTAFVTAADNLKANLDSPSFTGNVSIGTTPVANYKLTVAGGILAGKVKVAVVAGAQWSDYVFADNYPLKPLAEVEAFVKEHKHLPGVSSADDMVKEGLDVLQMDAKLLEKIEELTLYLIEIKKEVEALKQENKELKAASTNPKQ